MLTPVFPVILSVGTVINYNKLLKSCETKMYIKIWPFFTWLLDTANFYWYTNCSRWNFPQCTWKNVAVDSMPKSEEAWGQKKPSVVLARDSSERGFPYLAVSLGWYLAKCSSILYIWFQCFCGLKAYIILHGTAVVSKLNLSPKLPFTCSIS